MSPPTSSPTSPGQTVTETSPKGVGIAPDDRTLSEAVEWGGCQDKPQLVVTAQDRARVVLVLRTTSHYRKGIVCPDIVRTGTATLVLDAPLDGRVLIDGVTGATIPLR